ncbi:MAG: thiamine-phosphate kinase [Candidatus Sericytochromatia bacterium]|nr:thiamine-phosphate kinase [Candidatus Sericytochromatia bacterium]
MKKTTLAAIKEAGILDVLSRHLDGTGLPASWIGIGDDAAVTRIPSDTSLLTTVDLLVEDIHFTRATFSPEDLAWKALAVNVSDIRAMGGHPLWSVLGLALPGDLETSWLEAFASGLADACRHFGVPVVGGDTTGSRGPISLSVTVVGATLRPVLRGSARPGDRLVASGPFGWAAAGLWCLRHPEAAIPEPVRIRAEQAQRRPEPASWPDAWYEMERLALMDDSDGLATSAATLAEASGVAIEIRDAQLAGDDTLEALAVAAEADVRQWQLAGGEDYGLVACVPPEAALPPGWRELGSVTAGQGAWLVTEGSRRRLTSRGWDHFLAVDPALPRRRTGP